MRSRFFHIFLSGILLCSLSGFTVMRVVCAYEMATAKQRKKHECCPKQKSEPLTLGLCCEKQVPALLSDAAPSMIKGVDFVRYILPQTLFFFQTAKQYSFVASCANAPPSVPEKYLRFANLRN